MFALTMFLVARAAAGEVLDRAQDLFAFGSQDRISAAANFFMERGNPDATAALILAMRYQRSLNDDVLVALQALTGEKLGPDWEQWMLWQQANPQIKPFSDFDDLHAWVHSRIDPAFRVFVRPGVEHEIRLEEITWGGVRKDGIPALNFPKMIGAQDAGYLEPDNLVFGVAINGDARAYPLRILNWHEMFNDVVGGVPVALAYCTLCGSGILFERNVPGFPRPLLFGSSGFLYRSNKLMYDTYTHSLWNQFTGRPVVGALTNSGIVLKVRPVVITTWRRWRADHPQTNVLDLDTGFPRDYGTDVAYRDYFASPDLMFPALVDETDLKQKDYVFVLREQEAERAWPLARFEGGAVVNDTIGGRAIVLIGDAATRSVRAYDSGGLKFTPAEGGGDQIVADGAVWRIGEDALTGPAGQRLPRLPGHISYWFAWQNYFGETGELAVSD